MLTVWDLWFSRRRAARLALGSSPVRADPVTSRPAIIARVRATPGRPGTLGSQRPSDGSRSASRGCLRNRQIRAIGNTTTEVPTRRRSSLPRRTGRQVAADARADELAVTLGRALADRRRQQGLLQAQVAEGAGLAPSTVSAAERGGGAGYTISTWTRLARAVDVDLRAYLDQASAAGQPRDIVHLRNQELVIRTAVMGGCRSRPEHALGDPTRGARSIDVLLARPLELAVMEVFDWFEDVGAAARSWDRKLARVEALALARLPPPVQDIEVRPPRVSGCWIVHATRRNRELVAAPRPLPSSLARLRSRVASRSGRA